MSTIALPVLCTGELKMNLNAIVPNVYISSISYCIKMHKTSLLSNVTETCSCKNLVLAQFEPFEVQCYEVNVICCEENMLITKLTDTWYKFCYNEFIFNRKCISVPRTYCQCR